MVLGRWQPVEMVLKVEVTLKVKTFASFVIWFIQSARAGSLQFPRTLSTQPIRILVVAGTARKLDFASFPVCQRLP